MGCDGSGDMHYKACEMLRVLQPVMVQNNAAYCQTLFNETSVLPPHSQSEELGYVYHVWCDLLQQLP